MYVCVCVCVCVRACVCVCLSLCVCALRLRRSRDSRFNVSSRLRDKPHSLQPLKLFFSLPLCLYLLRHINMRNIYSRQAYSLYRCMHRLFIHLRLAYLLDIQESGLALVMSLALFDQSVNLAFSRPGERATTLYLSQHIMSNDMIKAVWLFKTEDDCGNIHERLF